MASAGITEETKMRQIKFFHHTDGTPNGRIFCKRHLPVRQTLIWAGPVFILLQPRRRAS
jgi:hypothetical protein